MTSEEGTVKGPARKERPNPNEHALCRAHNFNLGGVFGVKLKDYSIEKMIKYLRFV